MDEQEPVSNTPVAFRSIMLKLTGQLCCHPKDAACSGRPPIRFTAREDLCTALVARRKIRRQPASV
jgi:hypothetical protein